MITLRVKKVRDNAVIPAPMTSGAACVDFTIAHIEEVKPGQIIVYLGLAVEVPEGYVLTIQPRSSFTHKGWIMANSPAQIDSDYRGEIMLKMEGLISWVVEDGETWLNNVPFPYNVGDRVAQGKLEIVTPIKFSQVEELSVTDRATGGFGSTGN